MNINRMSDVELVREIAGRCITDMAAVDLAEFIRQCVKDSMPTEDEIAKILLRWDSVIADSELARDMAHALREAMEGK